MCGKRCYPNHPEASRAAEAFRRREGFEDHGLKPYRCKHCHGTWHLGHVPGNHRSRLSTQAYKRRKEEEELRWRLMDLAS